MTRSLVVIDPGHFHAALLQGAMPDGVSPEVQVYAPLGPELRDYLARIERFNARADNPTRWTIALHGGADFRDALRQAPAGGIAIIAGRNRDKIALIEAAVAADLNVLADKPMILRAEHLPRLERVLSGAARRGRIVRDLMTGRHEITAILLRALHADPAVFGEQQPGTPDAPGVEMLSVHHLLKIVSGAVNRRPAWYFDIAEQGNGLADIGTHLIDQLFGVLSPGVAIDRHAGLAIDDVRLWPTPIDLAQFREVTGEAGWPDFLAATVKDDRLDYLANGRLACRIRGVQVALEAVWNWQAPPGGGDLHRTVFRGTRAQLEVRQDPAQGEHKALIVVPQSDVGDPLRRWVSAQQAAWPGVAVEPRGAEWHIVIPARYRVGHEAHFIDVMREVVHQVAWPDTLPACEVPNLLAKYALTTGAMARAAQTF